MSSFSCSLLAILPPKALPGRPLIGNNVVFYSVAGAALLGLILFVLWVRRFRVPVVDAEEELSETLGDYPPAGPGPQRVFVHGQPVRLRLVVLAPLGKQPLPARGGGSASLTKEDFSGMLDLVLHGLGDIANQDRPRVRVWPPQLSSQGFAPTFFRLSHRPEQADTPSPWILAAGPVRAGGQQFLVGLALCADEPIELGNLSLQANQWSEVFRIGPRTRTG